MSEEPDHLLDFSIVTLLERQNSPVHQTLKTRGNFPVPACCQAKQLVSSYASILAHQETVCFSEALPCSISTGSYFFIEESVGLSLFTTRHVI